MRPLNTRTYVLAGVGTFALAIAAGTAGDPIVAGLLVFTSAACVILALLRPRTYDRCDLCGNHSFGRRLCYPCRQRFGDGQ